ncbi:heme peroxidase [Roridomyces roridus]|uniref:Peroxidase n=1 Tax=Roridomyces roridus TaxID=1738132 RepID=A0AAD7B923_9AGAR|nr:heme peroxidase [Roridomyces roridus]
MPLPLLVALATYTSHARASPPIWPSPKLDALESARFDQFGFNAGIMPGFIQPCDSFLFADDTGRSNAADWIRTAYHDMATHSTTDGTGGLDASIRLDVEMDRTENAGDGFRNTFIIVSGATNRYFGVADALALAAVIAIENCGGPEIAYRGGRIDAIEANAPGVPEPQQDLRSHIASFARQGFTQTEMISLVACGRVSLHSFGGVQHDPFPNIVNELNDPANTDDVAHFDTTFVHFDNNVATEYISGTTQNPLVAGFNDTTNSDKRIFGSDGNVTMSSLADSPSLFASTCAELFARMIDTVPSDVQLTDVITPLPVKPDNVELTMVNDTIRLSGQVRLWNTDQASAGTVGMLWDDHLGGQGNTSLAFAGTASSTGGKYNSVWYGFNAVNPFGFIGLDATAGIERLRFVVNGKLEDQEGVGFEVQDAYMFSLTSCLYSLNGGEDPLRLDVVVRSFFPQGGTSLFRTAGILYFRSISA